MWGIPDRPREEAPNQGGLIPPEDPPRKSEPPKPEPPKPEPPKLEPPKLEPPKPEPTKIPTNLERVLDMWADQNIDMGEMSEIMNPKEGVGIRSEMIKHGEAQAMIQSAAQHKPVSDKIGEMTAFGAEDYAKKALMHTAGESIRVGPKPRLGFDLQKDAMGMGMSKGEADKFYNLAENVNLGQTTGRQLLPSEDLDASFNKFADIEQKGIDIELNRPEGDDTEEYVDAVKGYRQEKKAAQRENPIAARAKTLETVFNKLKDPEEEDIKLESTDPLMRAIEEAKTSVAKIDEEKPDKEPQINPITGKPMGVVSDTLKTIGGKIGGLLDEDPDFNIPGLDHKEPGDDGSGYWNRDPGADSLPSFEIDPGPREPWARDPAMPWDKPMPFDKEPINIPGPDHKEPGDDGSGYWNRDPGFEIDPRWNRDPGDPGDPGFEVDPRWNRDPGSEIDPKPEDPMPEPPLPEPPLPEPPVGPPDIIIPDPITPEPTPTDPLEKSFDKMAGKLRGIATAFMGCCGVMGGGMMGGLGKMMGGMGGMGGMMAGMGGMQGMGGPTTPREIPEDAKDIHPGLPTPELPEPEEKPDVYGADPEEPPAGWEVVPDEAEIPYVPPAPVAGMEKVFGQYGIETEDGEETIQGDKLPEPIRPPVDDIVTLPEPYKPKFPLYPYGPDSMPTPEDDGIYPGGGYGPGYINAPQEEGMAGWAGGISGRAGGISWAGSGVNPMNADLMNAMWTGDMDRAEYIVSGDQQIAAQLEAMPMSTFSGGDMNSPEYTAGMEELYGADWGQMSMGEVYSPNQHSQRMVRRTMMGNEDYYGHGGESNYTGTGFFGMPGYAAGYGGPAGSRMQSMGGLGSPEPVGGYGNIDEDPTEIRRRIIEAGRRRIARTEPKGPAGVTGPTGGRLNTMGQQGQTSGAPDFTGWKPGDPIPPGYQAPPAGSIPGSKPRKKPEGGEPSGALVDSINAWKKSMLDWLKGGMKGQGPKQPEMNMPQIPKGTGPGEIKHKVAPVFPNEGNIDYIDPETGIRIVSDLVDAVDDLEITIDPKAEKAVKDLEITTPLERLKVLTDESGGVGGLTPDPITGQFDQITTGGPLWNEVLPDGEVNPAMEEFYRSIRDTKTKRTTPPHGARPGGELYPQEHLMGGAFGQGPDKPEMGPEWGAQMVMDPNNLGKVTTVAPGKNPIDVLGAWGAAGTASEVTDLEAPTDIPTPGGGKITVPGMGSSYYKEALRKVEPLKGGLREKFTYEQAQKYPETFAHATLSDVGPGQTKDQSMAFGQQYMTRKAPEAKSNARIDFEAYQAAQAKMNEQIAFYSAAGNKPDDWMIDELEGLRSKRDESMFQIEKEESWKGKKTESLEEKYGLKEGSYAAGVINPSAGVRGGLAGPVTTSMPIDPRWPAPQELNAPEYPTSTDDLLTIPDEMRERLREAETQTFGGANMTPVMLPSGAGGTMGGMGGIGSALQGIMGGGGGDCCEEIKRQTKILEDIRDCVCAARSALVGRPTNPIPPPSPPVVPPVTPPAVVPALPPAPIMVAGVRPIAQEPNVLTMGGPGHILNDSRGKAKRISSSFQEEMLGEGNTNYIDPQTGIRVMSDETIAMAENPTDYKEQEESRTMNLDFLRLIEESGRQLGEEFRNLVPSIRELLGGIGQNAAGTTTGDSNGELIAGIKEAIAEIIGKIPAAGEGGDTADLIAEVRGLIEMLRTGGGTTEIGGEARIAVHHKVDVNDVNVRGDQNTDTRVMDQVERKLQEFIAKLGGQLGDQGMMTAARQGIKPIRE